MKIVFALALTLTLQLTHGAEDLANGERLFKLINCAQCHGKKGLGKAKMKDGELKLSAVKGPQIANLNEAYMLKQLKDIKAKVRKTNYTTSMWAKIKKLSDKDLADLAAYVSKKLNPAAPKVKGINEK